MNLLRTAAAACLVLALFHSPALGAERLNFLLVTTDDMSCDSVGAYGCRLAGTTPHMDRLAARALRFNHAFVQVGNCFPSRNVMWSGRYPHTTRVEGFYQVKDPDYPHLSDLMRAGGWFTGIRGKVSHSTPYSPYPGWDADLDTLPDGTRAHIKDARSYFLSTADGIARAKAAGKPFCLNINISDPHKPFYAEGGRADPHVPSRVFTAEEAPVPGFLFDDPQVRAELAEYYSSVRRADDCLGEVLRALEESGEAGRTLVLFLSDHGMPLPFAKTQVYFHSTRTPLMVLWPGVTRAGAVDDEHLVSAVDLTPTLLEAAGLPAPTNTQKRIFAPVLRG
ncbi:MAG TPA: sulfatase-like hydrolase/transferase, partial [Prosthecobacter sp.]|nr:sulfatase-like hydrolase/transferase [Prosthecobacter sp.]